MATITEERIKNDNSIVIQVTKGDFTEQEAKEIGKFIRKMKGVQVYVFNKELE